MTSLSLKEPYLEEPTNVNAGLIPAESVPGRPYARATSFPSLLWWKKWWYLISPLAVARKQRVRTNVGYGSSRSFMTHRLQPEHPFEPHARHQQPRPFKDAAVQ